MVSKMSVETCFTVGFSVENSLKTMVEHIIDYCIPPGLSPYPISNPFSPLMFIRFLAFSSLS